MKIKTFYTMPKPAMKNGNTTCKKIVYHLSLGELLAVATKSAVLKLKFETEFPSAFFLFLN